MVAHTEYVGITLMISGFQQCGLGLKAPDYLLFSARPDVGIMTKQQKSIHNNYNHSVEPTTNVKVYLQVTKQGLHCSTVLSVTRTRHVCRGCEL